MGIKVLKLADNTFSPVEFIEFVNLTLREATGVNSEYLLRVGDVYVATGDISLLAAINKNPKTAVAFSELINLLLPNWTSDMMDMRIIDLPIVLISEQTGEYYEKTIKTIQDTFIGAKIVNG